MCSRQAACLILLYSRQSAKAETPFSTRSFMIEHTIVGTVRVLDQIHSPELGNQRDILVYLPPGYDASRQRYPVIYMHDGQNLFDQATSYNDEWQVDETMEAL